MKKLLVGVFIGAMLMTAACSAGDKGTVYKYDEPEVISGFVLTKSVYGDDTVTVYHDGSLNSSYHLYSSLDIEYVIDDETIVVTCDEPSEFTSFTVDNGDYKYQVRYLDSNQYSVMGYVFACDLGWEELGNNSTNYYTSEEIEEQNSRREALQAEFNEKWNLIEGYYESDSGDYIEFYINESGAPTMVENARFYPVLNIYLNGTSLEVMCQDDFYEYSFVGDMAGDGSYIEVLDYSDRTHDTVIRYNRTEPIEFDDEQTAALDSICGRWRHQLSSGDYIVYMFYENNGRYFVIDQVPVYVITDVEFTESGFVITYASGGLSHTMELTFGTDEYEGMLYHVDTDRYYENIG